MANSLSAEVWLDQRRWDALEEALKAQGSDIEQHLQDYLISLYNEMVPQEQWEQVEKRISNEAAETAREAEEHTVYTVFHVREHGHDSIFSTGNGEEFLDVAIRLRRYLWGGKTVVKGDFSQRFYNSQPITRERFDELAILRLENTGKVTGAFEINLDAGWISGLCITDGWQTFQIKDVSAAAYHATRSSRMSLEDRWKKFINRLDGNQIEPESFASAEIGGLRPLEKGDILCIDGPFLTDRELKFRLDVSSYGVQKEVLNLMTDCSKPENSLEITCSYDAARQGISNKLDLTLRQKNGMVRHDFFYPLMEEERAHLLKIEKDIQQAVELFTLAAEQGNSFAAFALGKLYLSGDAGLPIDPPSALKWLTFSAELGNQFAQYRLGKLLLQGEEVPKDTEAAIRWLTAAAEQGNQYAQYALGKLYLLGKEVPKDKSNAIKWFQLAADQGNEYAKYFLEHMDDRLGQPPAAAVISLLHHLANIFQEQSQPPSDGIRVAVDRKLLRKIKAKKIAQGHKADDHEPEMKF